MSFEKKGVVSIWVFRDKENPADADKDILKEFAGVEFYDLDSQEGVVSEFETPLVDLVSKLSYSESFTGESMNAANKMNIKKGFGILAQYDFAYDPGKILKPIKSDPIFLGCFSWHD